MKYCVSIIIPIYNVEKYLSKCLDSVLNQTFNSIEIILVNDGSTDNSESIINKYKKEYPHLVVLNKNNGGLSSARNAGLKYATGEYVLFIDSDDYINKQMVEILYNKAKRDNVDVVISKYTLNYESNNRLEIFKVNYDERLIINNEKALEMFMLGEVTGHACNKLIKRELLEKNNISFPEGMLYEDAPTTFQILLSSEKISFVNESFYFYVQREGSITKAIKLKTVEDQIKILDIVSEYLKSSNCVSINSVYDVFTINQLFYNSSLLSKVKYIEEPELLKTYQHNFDSRIKLIPITVLTNKYLKLKDKIKFLMLKTMTYRSWNKCKNMIVER